MTLCLASCATLPPGADYPREASHALETPQQTTLGALTDAYLARLGDHLEIDHEARAIVAALAQELADALGHLRALPTVKRRFSASE